MENPTNMKATRCVPDTKYARTMKIIGDVVHMKHVTDLKDGDHYMEHAITLANLDRDTEVKYIVSSIIIQMRQRFLRALTGSEVDKLGYVLDPTDYPATGGAGITARERSVRDHMTRLGIDREEAEYYLDHEDEFLTEAEIMKAKIRSQFKQVVKLRKKNDNNK